MLKVAFNMVANGDTAKSGCLPISTAGGAITSGEPLMFGGAFDQRSEATLFSNGPNERSAPLASRSDVLVFQTPELQDDLVLTGIVKARVWVSLDCLDTDFTIKLVDLYPPSDSFPAIRCQSEQWRATRQQNRFPDRSQSAAFWRTLTFHYQLADYRRARSNPKCNIFEG